MRVFIVLPPTPRHAGSCFATRDVPVAPTGPYARPIRMADHDLLGEKEIADWVRWSPLDEHVA